MYKKHYINTFVVCTISVSLILRRVCVTSMHTNTMAARRLEAAADDSDSRGELPTFA